MKISFTLRRFPHLNLYLRRMSLEKSDSEWRAILTKEQFRYLYKFDSRVIREKGTEAPGTGEFNKHKEKGVYTCAACKTPLVIMINFSIRLSINLTLAVDGQRTLMQSVLYINISWCCVTT
jgi:hypothetical protein